MALALDAGNAFAIDKPAGIPCPHLSKHRCTIHADLKDRGFTGCIAYECAGAGQHTIALFDGESWQDNPDLLDAQMDTFRDLKSLHNLMELLTAAAALNLPADVDETRLSLLAQLAPTDLTPPMAKSLANGPLPKQTTTFLRSLAAYAPQRP